MKEDWKRTPTTLPVQGKVVSQVNELTATDGADAVEIIFTDGTAVVVMTSEWVSGIVYVSTTPATAICTGSFEHQCKTCSACGHVWDTPEFTQCPSCTRVLAGKYYED